MKTVQMAVLFTLAAAAPAAFAQAGSVQIYGTVAAGISHRTNQAGGGSLDELSNSQLFNSYLGFRGTEDLGGGMTAVFRLEGGVAPDTGVVGATVAGSSRFFNRQSLVGLGMGKSGTVTLGRQFHAGIDRAIQTLDVYNLAGSSLYSTPLALFGVNRYAGNDSRVDNSVKYRVNLPAGVTLGASYGLGEAVSGSGGDSWSIDVGQTTPTYALGLYAINYRSPTVIAASGVRPSYAVWGLGGNARVGAGKVYLHYMNNHADATTATGVAAVNRITVVGLEMPTGPVTVKTAWTHDRGTGLNGVSGRNGAKDTLALSAEYAMSVRTSLYAAYFLNRFKDGYKLDQVNIAAMNRDPAASSVAVYSVGVRHNF